MKYLIIPIFKTIVFLFVILICYPMMAALSLLGCLWEWSWKPWKEVLDMPFSSTKALRTDKENNLSIEVIAYYKTPWDWYRGNKTIIYDLETSTL